jgi:hypothetical protein
MTLAALIRKRESRDAATAIPAIPATQQVQEAATVAKIASVAVAMPQKAKTEKPANGAGGDTAEAQEATYHSFTLVELASEAADDWPELQHEAAQLEAFADALKTSRTRLRGERPDYYTKVAECADCGPVWLWEGSPDDVFGCPWCLNIGPVPRPGPIRCRDWAHWMPDTINPPGGLETCEKGMPGLARPTRKLQCEQYQEMV